MITIGFSVNNGGVGISALLDGNNEGAGRARGLHRRQDERKAEEEEALEEKSRWMKLPGAREIDFRVAGGIDFARRAICPVSISWMYRRMHEHAQAMNIAFRYLSRGNCPRGYLLAALISC